MNNQMPAIAGKDAEIVSIIGAWFAFSAIVVRDIESERTFVHRPRLVAVQDDLIVKAERGAQWKRERNQYGRRK